MINENYKHYVLFPIRDWRTAKRGYVKVSPESKNEVIKILYEIDNIIMSDDKSDFQPLYDKLNEFSVNIVKEDSYIEDNADEIVVKDSCEDNKIILKRFGGYYDL